MDWFLSVSTTGWPQVMTQWSTLACWLQTSVRELQLSALVLNQKILRSNNWHFLLVWLGYSALLNRRCMGSICGLKHPCMQQWSVADLVVYLWGSCVSAISQADHQACWLCQAISAMTPYVIWPMLVSVRQSVSWSHLLRHYSYTKTLSQKKHLKQHRQTKRKNPHIKSAAQRSKHL